MRRCLIGLSTPIGYYYGYILEPNRPNPILEAPIGLFLLYDEIWFLHRRLCPYNMEELEYVHFVNEEYDVRFIDKATFSKCNEIASASALHKQIIHSNLISQHSVVSRHVKSQGKKFHLNGKAEVVPGCLIPSNYIFDHIIADTFNFDLVTNTFFQKAIKPKFSVLNQSSIATRLICDEFPNFQAVDGPYLDLIEDFRSDSALKSFRKKITLLENPDPQEIQPIIAALDSELRHAGESLIKEACGPGRIYKGLCNSIIGQIPLISNIFSALEGIHSIYKAIKERRQFQWMAFVSRSKEIVINDLKRKPKIHRKHRHV
jgi:hypothetical protein